LSLHQGQTTVGECKANVESERALAECVPLIESGKMRAGVLLKALHAQRFHLLAGMAMGRCPIQRPFPSEQNRHGDVSGKRVWVRGSLEVKTEHSTQLPPRRPVPSVSTQVPGKCHLPATQGLPSIKHGNKELRRVPGKASAICFQPATLPWGGQTVPSSATP